MTEDAERLLALAMALDPALRAPFVEAASRGNPQLQGELMSLLSQAGAAEQFFDLLTDAVFSASLSGGEDRSGPPAGPALVLMAGAVIGQYRILSRIGSGGMGTVYRAHDTRLHRDVALKFLPSDLGARPEAEERLLVEARAAAALEHPNVCSVHEIGETDDGRRFIAMAFYEGETLKERLRRGPLSPGESVAHAVQIARGLAAAHARGIIHRDVKPANVLLGSEGTVRLLDFGLAMTADATLTRTGSTTGTLAYMSPEQARGDALDPRTDLWSLGVVLYEMLAGSRPFQGATAGELLRAILDADPEPLATRRPGLPEAVVRIVERLLREDAASRYDSATEVLADLEQARPAATGTAQPGSSTRPRPILRAAVLLLLVALGGAWLVFSGRGERARPVATAPRLAEPSIAVLPLTNLSADSGDAALALGMTEELITTLARTGDVRVIASTSTAGFSGREVDVRQVAEGLGVSNLLQGTVQKSGSQLRVQVRLIAGSDGSTRWSQAYQREFQDVFAVQDEIARAVASELGLRFDKERQLGRHRTQSAAAYALYLRGSDPVLLRSPNGVWTAQDYLEQAIAADSTYAAAHAGLALVYVRRGRTANDPGMPPRDLLALAERTARRAVGLDDSLPEAHYALGRVLEAKLEFPAAEAEIRRAIALDPNRSIYRRSLSYLHAWAGQPEAELAEAQQALATDPLNPYALAAVASGLYGNRRFDEAMAQFARLAALQPPLQAVAFGMALCYAEQRRLPEAIAALRPLAEAGDPQFQAFLGHMLARSGQQDEAARLLARLRVRQERTGVGAFQVAVVYVGLGDVDQAFVWLDKSIDDRSIGSVIMGPAFAGLQRDSRFQLLRRRLGYLQ